MNSRAQSQLQFKPSATNSEMGRIQQQFEQLSNQSSVISSVKLSNFYSSEREEQSKPSQIDLIAQKFSARVSQNTEETAQKYKEMK